MSKRLYIRMGSEAPARTDWATVDGDGRLETGSAPLAQVPHAPGDRLVVMVPGTEVLVTEVKIPGRRRRLLRQSLPFLLEESLADEVEELHFASGPPGPDGLLPVATVARPQMVHWLALLAEAGLTADILIPATMAVPITPGRWTVVLKGPEFLARQATWRMAAGETANLGYYLAPVGPEAETPSGAGIVDCNGAGQPLELAGLEIASSTTADFMTTLVEGYNTSPSFNLLQGEFARGARWLEVLRRWRLPLAASLLLAVLTATGLAHEYLRLRRESTRLTEEINASYLRAFPGSRVVNAKVQMEQRLDELLAAARLQSNFFTLYDKMAPLAATAKGFDLDTLRFQGNRLELELSIDNLQGLEKLKTDLSKAPELRAEIRNAESSGGKVRARLVVEARK